MKKGSIVVVNEKRLGIVTEIDNMDIFSNLTKLNGNKIKVKFYDNGEEYSYSIWDFMVRTATPVEIVTMK